MFHNSGRPTVVFISAELAALSPEANAKHSDSLRADLERFEMNWVPALGSYKGTKEQSNMVILSDYRQLDRLKDLMQFYGQESIMVRNSDESVELHYINGKIQHVKGKLVEVSPTEAATLDAWTNINGKYWTVK